MSLPNGFLDELRARVSLSAIVGRKVTWDMRKSNQAKGDWWAPCPFHQEKSASFHVDDRKGFYYCFGCHAKGDALTFLKEAENLPFMEAVERLAREAGMEMPARDPRATEVADRRAQIIVVLEEAARFFRLQLRTGAAKPARDYLEQKRKLNEAAQERWEIGWAPDSRHALLDALRAKGVAPDLMVASGLIAKGDDGSLYDRFRGRIMFPIRDARGRAISFGGRSLDPQARAKYLNGPETEVFDKGRTLFNLSRAREAVAKGQRLVVAEGYMDVIALSEAGFTAAVAPLGTAVTEDQLRLIWRLSPEPVIALDGDKAGIRAALRVVDLALPLIEAGQGLRFAVLPGGQDPDDLLKAEGAPAMQKVLDGAQPMVDLLWAREIEGQVFDSPERKAALDKRLRAAIAKINDPGLRAHYGEDIKALRWELFRQGRKPVQREARPAFQPGGFGQSGFGQGKGGWQGKGWRDAPLPPAAATRASALAAGGESRSVIELRVEAVLVTLALYPALIATHETRIERMRLAADHHRRMRDAILHHAHDADPETCAERLAAACGPDLETLLGHPQIQVQPHIRRAGDRETALKCLETEFAKLEAFWGAEQELSEAQEDITGFVDEGLTWRLGQAAQARIEADRGPETARAEGIIAPNGVEMNREELDHAEKLRQSIDFTRGGRARS